MALALVVKPAIAQAPQNGQPAQQYSKQFVAERAIPYVRPMQENPPAASIPPGKDEIVSYIQSLWGKEAKTAITTFTCESGLNEKSVNWNDAKITGKPSLGIAQLNRPYDAALLEWKTNLDEAYQLYLKRGFEPWSCYYITRGVHVPWQ